ncbi:cobalamin-binding protein [Clostridium sp. HV4-5-A1G]|nr:cobalamin-binding protein [Clostridium sp. HV4-5-A1G]
MEEKMHNLSELKKLIIKYVEQLDEEKVINLADEALDKGMDPITLLETVNIGMEKVGKLYENKDYYIADLILSGLIFRNILELDKMKKYFLQNKDKGLGKVVLGTVKGDIHDIGKDIFKGMLEANGFEVIDLGVDVPKEEFVKAVKENKPDIVAMSAALTNTIETMRDVVKAFLKAGIRDKVKVIAGANHMNADISKYIGADDFSNEASTGTKICLKWMKEKQMRSNK